MPMTTQLQILYEDEHVLAVNKPPGLLVIPGGEADEQTLKDLVAEYLAPRGERPFVVHRLDRGTSGVVLFARNAAAHRALNLAFDHRAVKKGYLALVDGDLQGEHVIQIPLHAARRGKMRPAGRGEPGLRSHTRWRAVERFERFTFLEVEPFTGRQHQIRVHLKAIGHPLAFDPLYGRKTPLLARDLNPAAAHPDVPALARTPLHAAWIRVPHPTRTEPLVVEAPLPDDVRQVLTLLRASGQRLRRAT